MNSRHPEVLAVKAELDAGVCSSRYQALRRSIAAEIASTVHTLDTILVHNALSLHKNLALTGALWDVATESAPRWIAWHHDVAWDRPDYADELHEGEPWSLLRTPMPGSRQNRPLISYTTTVCGSL